MENAKEIQLDKKGIPVAIEGNSKRIVIEKEDKMVNGLTSSQYRQLIHFAINNKQNVLHLAYFNQNISFNNEYNVQ